MENGGEMTREDILHGAYFNVKYAGSMEVAASMKSLDFDRRTAIAKEAIVRVCEAASLIRQRSRRPEFKDILQEADLTHSGTDVSLIVSRDALAVVPFHRPSGAQLFSHPMPNVSFASSGDEFWLKETGEFVCYVAKSESAGRRCYVFECGILNASALLSAIGLAFKIRFEDAQMAHENAVNAAVAATPQRPAPPPLQPSQAQNEPALLGLESEPWYHGGLSRAEAEALLRVDGDFLVRKSGQGENQFVLTGLQGGSPKHLLLIDTDGKVRTRDRQFPSVAALIAYHRENNLPITSAESALILKRPLLHNSGA